jgi:hypothetical protein
MSFSKMQTSETSESSKTFNLGDAFETIGINVKNLGRGAKKFAATHDNLELITKLYEEGKAVTACISVQLPTGMERHVTLTFRHDDEFKGRKTRTTALSRACAVEMLIGMQQRIGDIKVTLRGFVDFGPFVAAIVHLGEFHQTAQIMREMLDREAPASQNLHNLHLSTCMRLDKETGKLTTRGDDVWGEEHDFWAALWDEANAVGQVYLDGDCADLPFKTCQHLNEWRA